MLIYKNNSTKKDMVFIHIPKNSGKFIRDKIKNDNNNTLLKAFWGIKNNVDVAHIPYLKRKTYIKDSSKYVYFAYSRNPYYRIISAFFYLNRGKSVNDFKHFCINILPRLNFNLDFNKDYIHYYPQYLFVCNIELKVTNVTVTKIEDSESPKVYDLKEYMDAPCIKVINSVYEKDFKFFHYDMISELYK